VRNGHERSAMSGEVGGGQGARDAAAGSETCLCHCHCNCRLPYSSCQYHCRPCICLFAAGMQMGGAGLTYP